MEIRYKTVERKTSYMTDSNHQEALFKPNKINMRREKILGQHKEYLEKKRKNQRKFNTKTRSTPSSKQTSQQSSEREVSKLVEP
jgi:hypothetical protein